LNKLIFQLGLLAFFVAAVVFGLEHNPVMEILSRAFIVFIAVVVTSSGILALGIVLASRNKTTGPDQRGTTSKTVHPTT
jgi:hypothetical protein